MASKMEEMVEILKNKPGTVRYVGIRHRIKKTQDGKERPTQVAILIPKAGGITKLFTFDLDTETAELDWVKGEHPITFRAVDPAEDVSAFPEHHIKWAKVKKADFEEAQKAYHESQLTQDEKGRWRRADKVPEDYDGIRDGDTVAMTSGGSGYHLLFAVSRRSDDLTNATVLKLPTADLKTYRPSNRTKDDDAHTLAELAIKRADLFHAVTVRERDQIIVSRLWSQLVWLMKHRIATSQRLLHQARDDAFFREDGYFPEGTIERAYRELLANDSVHEAQLGQEHEKERDIMHRIVYLDVWKEIFEPFKGISTRIFSRIFSNVVDPMRFVVAPDYSECLTVEECRREYQRARRRSHGKFEKYCGLHVAEVPQEFLDWYEAMENGEFPLEGFFPRKSRGKHNRYTPELRQAAFLVGDQFNRQGERTDWGRKFRELKGRLRAKHPEAMAINQRKNDGGTYQRWIYTDQWIHTTAMWRTVKYAFRVFFWQWVNLEKRIRRATLGIPELSNDEALDRWRKKMEAIVADNTRRLEEETRPADEVDAAAK